MKTRHPGQLASPLKLYGYSLVELLVAMAVLSIVLVGVVMSMQSVQTAWQLTRSSVREFIEGRRAIETVVTHLSRATLHPRWVTDEPLSNSPPSLIQESDLHFVCGPTRSLLADFRTGTGHALFFQGSFGFAGSRSGGLDTPDSALYYTLPNVLNAWGYYVEFGRDSRVLPTFMTSPRQGRPPPPNKQRFRLMEFRQPAHELPLFFVDPTTDRPLLASQTHSAGLYEWFRAPLRLSHAGQSAYERRTSVVAENILALLVVPYDPQLQVLQEGASDSNLPYRLAPDYHYDSRRFQWEPASTLGAVTRHQLPPNLEIVVIALSEDSWDNLSEAEAINQGESLVGFMSGRFNIAANFANDLQDLSRELNRRRLGHKILTQIVSLNGMAGRLATTNVSPP